jgi:hypothetical protein
MRPWFAVLGLGVLVAGTVPSLAWAQRVSCESRDYQQNYCQIGGRVSAAWLVYQRSQAACIQGQTWGYDGGGIWVNRGCSAEFGYRTSRPSGNTVQCESRDYRQTYCATDARISNAWLVEQRSQAPCIQGRSWGWDNRGIWVTHGCEAVFAYEGGGRAPPPPPNRVACESQHYQYQYCGVGPRVARAWLIEQRSSAACVEGQTWGYRGNGIWVNQGCGGVFGFEGR